MDNSQKHSWFTPSESSNIQDSDRNSRVSNFVKQAHSLKTLHVVAGMCQVFLGLVVVTISILGFIKPLWLSTFLSMIASVTTMVGLGFLYASIHKSYNSKALLNRAMKRVMESQN